jgi:hypothetical protein
MNGTIRPDSSTLETPLADPAFPGATWYVASQAGNGFTYKIEPGTFAQDGWLTCDCLTDQATDLVLNLEFYEPGHEKPLMCRFTLLPFTQARLRFPLEAMNFNRWRYDREGGCLKPTIGGWHVDRSRVDRVVLKVLYKGPGPARWCMNPLRLCREEPPLLTEPVILGAPLLDSLGQATFRDWPGKTRDFGELRARLEHQLADAPHQSAPASFSRWGGWLDRRVEASGFFRTHHDDSRWWLVDPDGCLFWSVGPDCAAPVVNSNIRLLHGALEWLPPREGEFADCFGRASGENEPFDFLVANFIRVFGPEKWRDAWTDIVCATLRRVGFNTFGNWSSTATASRQSVPYVFPLPVLPPEKFRVARIFRDFPDVCDPAFVDEAADFASALSGTVGDPAMIGYFLMNEPQWGFARMHLAEGILRNAGPCHTLAAFESMLRERYQDDDALRLAWGSGAGFADIAKGKWTQTLSPTALADIKAFSSILVRKLYDTLSAACRVVDPHHLNLGARFASVPEDWILNGMGSFDVFSINCYRIQADAKLGEICQKLNVPALIGEWHFGALDAGLPAPGIGHVANQAGRGQAYRYFVEQSAAFHWCVGAHWFTLYDQSALGRIDGENYNIGFVDTCHRLYDALAVAARATHERLYDVATGAVPPFADQPQIVDRLNM